ncbi:hypothetical protein A9Q99_24915 [Gammaproteobacteria bacterium 45_16_T64]|nr:hypothetical protein A9Q99_24915 [Gammaproteobacteria bacterium 45_16_T64]
MQDLFSLAGKTALVTGGCRGIGRMMAEGLLGAGATVWVTGRDQEFVDAAVNEMSELGDCRGLVAELSNKQGITALVEAVVSEAPALNILVNNAAVYSVATFEESDYDTFNNLLQLNTTAAFELTRQLLPAFTRAAKPKDPARVINISSNIALTHCAWHSWGYATAKNALQHVTVMLASELTSQGINVNAIAPGTFDTRMLDGWRDENGEFDIASAGIPMGRFGEAEDVQGIITLLCARGGAFISGAVIPVDGASAVRPLF